MGRTLLVAAVLGAMAAPAAAQQPTPAPMPAPPPSGAEFYRQGQEMIARGDFVTATNAFGRALEAEPDNWEYKLALADAERQANQCDKAIPRYKELLDAAAADKARVKTSLQQCPNVVLIEPPAPAPVAAPPPVVAPPPKIIERTGPPSLVNGAMLVGAGAMFGASIGFYFAGRASESDAEDARSFADHERISTRGDRQKIASAVLMAGALGLGGYAIYRIKFRSERAELAVTPTRSGGAMVLRGSW